MELKKAWVYHRETSRLIARRKMTEAQINAYRAEGHSVMVPGEGGVIEVATRCAHKFAHEWTGGAPQ